MTTKTKETKSKRLDDGLEKLSKFEQKFKEEFGNGDLFIGMKYVNRACSLYRDPETSMFDPSTIMDGGLVRMHNGFLDKEIIRKAGNELEKASSLYNNLSLVYSDMLYSNSILAERKLPSSDMSESKNAEAGRMYFITKFISRGFKAMHGVYLMNDTNNAGDDALSYSTSSLRNAALNAIGWARVYNAAEVHRAYEDISLTEPFALLKDEEKLRLLLQLKDMNEFLRKPES